LKTNVTRKNGCVINTGDNPNKDERKRRIKENAQKYSIDSEEVALNPNLRLQRLSYRGIRMTALLDILPLRRSIK
jgi:hypothetical protein